MPPEINKDNCISCGKCVEFCSEDVFYGSVEGEQPIITYPEVCYHCYSCVLECPVENAIWIRTPMAMTVPYKK